MHLGLPHPNPIPPYYLPGVTAVSHDDSSVDSSSHVEISEPAYHQNVGGNDNQECELAVPNVVEPYPDP